MEERTVVLSLRVKLFIVVFFSSCSLLITTCFDDCESVVEVLAFGLYESIAGARDVLVL